MPVAPRKDPRQKKRRHKEEGFALLLVFLMAAMVAITLYLELPRVAMQSQRDKEETLIDRGEQYKRAIQLFVAKAKRYPGEIKDLENFQNQRFLRHRYIDPMTGKDEWRLIHIQNGVLTDSKLTKPTGPGKEEPKGPNGFVGELAGMGGTQNQGQGVGVPNQRDRRRTSDGANPNMPAPPIPGGDLSGGQTATPPALPGQGPDTGQQQFPGASNPGAQPLTGQPLTGQPLTGQPLMGQPLTGQPVQPGVYPGMQPGLTGQQGMPIQPGLPPGLSGMTNVNGMPGIPGRNTVPVQTTPAASGNSFVGGGGSFVGGGGSYVGGGSVTGSQPNNPGQATYPGQGVYPGQPLPGQPGMPVNSQMGGVSPYPIQPGANGTPVGFPQPGTVAGQGNAAADMIRNILTTPRPGGMPQGMAGAQTIGGGIAGVASNAEGEGVKVYNDRTLYQEWEFIYDPQKQKQIPNPNATGAGGTPADKMKQGTQPQTPASGFGSGFGSGTGTGTGVGPQTGRPPGQ
jgi:type II secretory pathway pseudopilin PulG